MTNQQTVDILDEFYGFRAAVPANEYDVVLSFFTGKMSDSQAARTFTSSLFIVSSLTGEPVMKLLEDLSAQDIEGLTVTMAFYMNQVRSNSALIGVAKAQKPNFYAARNVLP